ncbi:MAG: efflux RND transporter periplasmic adaptor subunit [Phycisphaerales bacterium]
MTSRSILMFTGLTAAALAALSLPLFAHEGHGKGEVAPYDLDTPRKVSPETAAHIGLETAEVDFGAVEEVLRLVGVVRPLPNSIGAITSRIDGTVQKVTVQVGDTVQEGDLLAELDSPQLAQHIYEARKLDTEYFELLGELARAGSRVEELLVQVEAATEYASIVEAQYARLQTNDGAIAVNVLSERQAAAVRARSEVRLREIEQALSRQQLDSMNKQAEAMQRSREAQREVIELIKAETGAPGETAPTQLAAMRGSDLIPVGTGNTGPGRLGLVRFYAPMDGVVIARNVKTGQGVEAGETLLEIADYSRVQIEGELPESLLDRLNPATKNQVRIRRVSDTNGETIGVGHVRFVSPVIDPIKRTTHLIIQADNPQGVLRDGLYVDLSIVLREETSAVVVPVSAVVTDGPMHFVFVFDKKGEFYKKHDIQPGYRDDRVVEVLDGVFPGDVIVTRGAYSLTQLRPKVGADELTEDASESGSENVESGDSRDSG